MAALLYRNEPAVFVLSSTEAESWYLLSWAWLPLLSRTVVSVFLL